MNSIAKILILNLILFSPNLFLLMIIYGKILVKTTLKFFLKYTYHSKKVKNNIYLKAIIKNMLLLKKQCKKYIY